MSLGEFIVLTLFCIYAVLKSSDGHPLNAKTSKEDTIAIYVPYDVKYVPLEVTSEDDSSDIDLNVEPLPSQKEDSSEKHHNISKRQTLRYPYYRPVLRFSRLSGSQRRIGGFSRRNGLVGYLNDRDNFPTVA